MADEELRPKKRSRCQLCGSGSATHRYFSKQIYLKTLLDNGWHPGKEYDKSIQPPCGGTYPECVTQVGTTTAYLYLTRSRNINNHRHHRPTHQSCGKKIMITAVNDGKRWRRRSHYNQLWIWCFKAVDNEGSKFSIWKNSLYGAALG